ncbi:MAG TPA: response regulator transcription factor [Polyangiaceae bacterium]|nr:response regulator transcription factor [Polyangiaceae bacterium]
MSRVRVLLADDHRILVEGLKSLLVPEFDLIGVVEDGRAMVEAAKTLRPDVIVADITMPHLNGMEALEEIKKFDPNVRVIFLTMHRDVAYARRALEAGAAGFVPKNSALHELVLAVRAAAQGRTFISPTLAGEIKQNPLETADPIASLTLRQREILRLLVDGLTAREIGAKLNISARTVEDHKYRMVESLGVKSNAELIHFAIKHGIDGP